MKLSDNEISDYMRESPEVHEKRTRLNATIAKLEKALKVFETL